MEIWSFFRSVCYSFVCFVFYGAHYTASSQLIGLFVIECTVHLHVFFPLLSSESGFFSSSISCLSRSGWSQSACCGYLKYTEEAKRWWMRAEKKTHRQQQSAEAKEPVCWLMTSQEVFGCVFECECACKRGRVREREREAKVLLKSTIDTTVGCGATGIVCIHRWACVCVCWWERVREQLQRKWIELQLSKVLWIFTYDHNDTHICVYMHIWWAQHTCTSRTRWWKSICQLVWKSNKQRWYKLNVFNWIDWIWCRPNGENQAEIIFD